MIKRGVWFLLLLTRNTVTDTVIEMIRKGGPRKMKKKKRNIAFIFLLFFLCPAVIFLSLFAYADQKLDPNQFKKEAISQEVSFDTKTPISKAHQEAVQVYQKTKDYRKSLEILQKAKIDELISKSPEQVSLTKEQNAAILNDYAYFLYLDKQLDKAVPILNRAIQFHPERTVAYLNRGDIYRDKYQKTKDNKYREFYLKDYRAYNEQMIRVQKSYLVPERVEKELYTLKIKKLIRAEDKKELSEKLLKAAEGNNNEEVIRLLKEGADPNAGAYDEKKHGWIPVGDEHKVALHFAAENNNIEMVKYLLNNGARLVETRQGLGALSFAATSADLEMVKYLVKKGENVSLLTRGKYPREGPIYYAGISEKSGYEVFEYILNVHMRKYGTLTTDLVDLLIPEASRLKNHDKSYRVIEDIYKIVEKWPQDEWLNKAFEKGYINSVGVDNKKLMAFYESLNVKVDKNQYIIALLESKRFREAKEEIENAKEIDGEVFSKLSLIPSYKTNWKCETGQMKYEGNELEELLVTAIKKYDVNKIPPVKYYWEKGRDYNWHVALFIRDITTYSERYPTCISREMVKKIIKLMLDHGLNVKLFYRDRFQYIVALDDVEFAKSLANQGLQLRREDYRFFYQRAKSMEMVGFLEAQRYFITKEDYIKILKEYEIYPDLIRTVDPQVVRYYQLKVK
jgi:hypothetical protein